MTWIILFFVLFISFFILYLLSKNDFVLLRKNIALSKIFDSAFLILIFSFVVGRLFYIIDSFRFGLLHWLTFFHILKFPGISLLGAFLGGLIALFFFKERSVMKRVSDIFYLAFYPIVVYAFIFGNWTYLPLVRIILIALIIILFAVLVRLHRAYTVHDGSITLIIIGILSLETFITHASGSKTFFSPFISLSSVLSLLIFFTTVVLFLLNEKLIGKKKK